VNGSTYPLPLWLYNEIAASRRYSKIEAILQTIEKVREIPILGNNDYLPSAPFLWAYLIGKDQLVLTTWH
jgi:hypothetical protein